MLLSLICVVPVHAMDLPAPPGGFSWREVPEIKAAFLVPSGWQFRRQTQGSTLAIFITPEGFDKDGQFSTGLTINVLRNAKPGTAETGVGTSIVHTLMVANPKTGTLYLFGFEAPVAGWTDAWTKGEKIMESLAVDDEV